MLGNGNTYASSNQSSPYAIRGNSKFNYDQKVPRKVSNNTINKSMDMNTFFHNPHRPAEYSQVFPYNEDQTKSRESDIMNGQKLNSDSIFDSSRKNRLLHSYNVPLKNKYDQYVEVVANDNKVSKRLLAKEVEVHYYEIDDEDEEDIPDEDTNTEISIKSYDRIVQRGAITNKLRDYSFQMNPAFDELSSVDNLSRRESDNPRIVSRGGGLSQTSSFSTPFRVYNRINNPLQDSQMNIVNDRNSARAISNWERMYSKLIYEYKQHRIRKALRNRPSPSPSAKQQVKRHQPKSVIRMRKGLKWYP